MKITEQYIKWSEATNDCTLITKFDNGAIGSEPLTSEEAAQWQAEHKY